MNLVEISEGLYLVVDKILGVKLVFTDTEKKHLEIRIWTGEDCLDYYTCKDEYAIKFLTRFNL